MTLSFSLPLAVSLVSVFALLSFSANAQNKGKAPACRSKSSCGVKRSTTPRSESVWIEITDETNGKVVTFQKEFKLDHIPPAQREKYIEYLENKYLYDGADEIGLADKPRNVVIRDPRDRTGRAPAGTRVAQRIR